MDKVELAQELIKLAEQYLVAQEGGPSDDDLWELRDLIEQVRDALNDTIEKAYVVSKKARQIGGAIKDIVQGHLDRYFIPTLERFEGDPDQRGSISSLLNSLDEYES